MYAVWGFLVHENMLCRGRDTSELLSNCCFLLVMIHQVNEHEIYQSLVKSDGPKRKYSLFKAFLFLKV